MSSYGKYFNIMTLWKKKSKQLFNFLFYVNKKKKKKARESERLESCKHLKSSCFNRSLQFLMTADPKDACYIQDKQKWSLLKSVYQTFLFSKSMQFTWFGNLRKSLWSINPGPKIMNWTTGSNWTEPSRRKGSRAAWILSLSLDHWSFDHFLILTCFVSIRHFGLILLKLT